MLSGHGGFHRGLSVPVVGCADDNGIDVLSGQEFFVVAVHLHVHVVFLTRLGGVLFFDPLLAHRQAIFVQIGHGNDAGYFVFHRFGQVMTTGNAPEADLADINLIAGRILAKHTGRNDGREHGSGDDASGTGSAGFQEGAAILMSVFHISFWLKFSSAISGQGVLKAYSSFRTLSNSLHPRAGKYR